MILLLKLGDWISKCSFIWALWKGKSWTCGFEIWHTIEKSFKKKGHPPFLGFVYLDDCLTKQIIGVGWFCWELSSDWWWAQFSTFTKSLFLMRKVSLKYGHFFPIDKCFIWICKILGMEKTDFFFNYINLIYLFFLFLIV